MKAYGSPVLPKSRFQNARILVVDDQPGNVRLLEVFLAEAGYRRVEGITDSTRVLECLDREPADLILLDMRMPVLDGLGVLTLLDDAIHLEGLQVIVLTAQTERETRLAALERGARDYLVKPFDNEEVLCRIHNALETRFLYQDRENEADRLEILVGERTQLLTETQFELVRCLARAGEFRDNDTGSHILRVSLGCHMLALAAGLPRKEVELIRYASMMHDIGKIGVSDDVLLKPARLTTDEFEHMKTHCKVGVDILGDYDADVTRMARDIAFTHHERWDGAGYPRGLHGKDIPIAGRITAIIDVYDALISTRPYKKALTVDEALQMIRDGAGRQFDPTLVDHFFAIQDEFQKQMRALSPE
ncbi:MAG TPA: HD domain-containing phosphohydrolase [Azospira sp.]|nr:HD domain-containing phosphohydrolase [Azospira sp.]